ncbi:MAG TPA: MFS transporter [Anaerolineales bacterium]|nr:MFS transporter [Anaerolineales bacterium]
MINASWNDTNWKARFFTIWGGQAISLFGSRLVQFALIWWLTAETGSATVLAIASLIGLLPTVLLGPFAGALVDRWKRRQVILIVDTAIALATLLLAYLFAIDAVGVTTVYVLLLVRGIGESFHWPSMSAATSLMVPDDQLTRVQGLNQMLQGGLNIVAAPLGALLLGILPMQAIMLIDVVTAAFAILPLLVISIPEVAHHEETSPSESPPTFWEDFRSGLQYVRSWPGLMMLMLLAMVVNFLLTPAGALMPILVADYFKGGPLQLGWIEAAFGFGMIAGGLALGAWGGFKKRILTSMLGLLGLGIGFSLIGFVPSNLFWLGVVSAFFAASMVPMVNGPVHAILQSAVEPEMQGRVFTLVGSLGSAMAPLGLIVAGPVADSIGVQSWYVIGGLACILMAVVGYSIPAVMNIEENHRKSGESVLEQVETPAPEVSPS